jgi:hypothetical protein
MPIFRWLIIGLAVWIVVVLVRRLIGNRLRATSTKTPAVQNSSGADTYPEVVPCCYCDLHVPKTEALKKNDRYYCCSQHRDTGDNPV